MTRYPSRSRRSTDADETGLKTFPCAPTGPSRAPLLLDLDALTGSEGTKAIKTCSVKTTPGRV
eukprot:CAMPEP_0114114644 /NCGR_PEP_ID=MMETSP0043_2-20121206/3542_1 /TAXON_ID=464988 /ORGANISM="Hemiselmis andersenii, Strain CCMP644" /LENGTH=62 /DNA_ID=CAMNT_0001206847 /DNA_START=357 /DNA_END=542 /DNA_ORIENTATION=+